MTTEADREEAQRFVDANTAKLGKDGVCATKTFLVEKVAEALATARSETWKAAAEHVRSQWLAAYPVDTFLEPPAGEHGTTVDGCSARMGRHMATKLIEEFEAAATAKKGK